MTPAIKPGQPRKRPERACLACRGAKSKCVASPDDSVESRCARCTRLKVDCVYVALKKIGRPRRLLIKPKEVKEESPSDLEYEIGSALLKRMSTGSSYTSVHMEVPRSPPDLPSEISYHCKPDDLDSIQQFYIDSIHTFLPILSSDPVVLTRYLQTCPLHLIVALTALQFPEIATSFPLSSLEPSLASVQAALFFGHASYGRGKPALVRECLKWASTTIVKLIEEMEFHAGRGDEYDYEEMDLIRRAYWECWTLEITTSVVLGLRSTFLQDLKLQVYLPDAEASDIKLSGLGIKIRALALLSECTLPPTGNAVDMGRIKALTDLGGNLTLLARESFRENAIIDTPKGRAARECSFMAGLIGSAAIIYLHRASFAASAFVCGLDSTTELTRETLFPVKRASRFIFDLLRESYSPKASHSPFFGCSLMIASTGTLSTLADGTSTEWDSVQISSDLELAEFLLNIQTNRWRGTQHILDSVRRMRFSLEIATA